MKVEEKHLEKVMKRMIKKYQGLTYNHGMVEIRINIYENGITANLNNDKDRETSMLGYGIGIGFKMKVDDYRFVDDKRTSVAKNIGKYIIQKSFSLRDIPTSNEEIEDWIEIQVEMFYEEVCIMNHFINK